MTAFARQTKIAASEHLIWEIRSVNHRYFECAMRLPESFRHMEVKWRELTKKYVSRGKVEATLRIQPNGEQLAAMPVNIDVVKSLAKATEDIASIFPDPAPISVMDVLRWPGVIQADDSIDDALTQKAQALLDKTLDELQSARKREGSALMVGIQQRLAMMQELIDEVAKKVPQFAAIVREKLIQRIQALDVDEQRLAQEVLFCVQKMDVTEELERLRAHLDEFHRHLSVDKPVGRRLDFMLQEMNREANTLGAKMSQAETAHVSVDLKVLIEQMREQIQNIE